MTCDLVECSRDAASEKLRLLTLLLVHLEHTSHGLTLEK